MKLPQQKEDNVAIFSFYLIFYLVHFFVVVDRLAFLENSSKLYVWICWYIMHIYIY